MFDVIIAGAGPAGTAAAYDLLQNGFRVLILDKKDFPRKKACAGGITPKAYQLYKYSIKPAVQRVCTQVKITPQKRASFYIKHDDPLCYMTDRSELDALSLKICIENGAYFQVINPIDTVKDCGSFVRISAGGKRYETKILIGADGANSLIRRHISRSFTHVKSFAVEADVAAENTCEYSMEFDFSSGFKGYRWIFPKKNHLNIGLYTTGCKIKQAEKLLKLYAEKKTGIRKINRFTGYPISVSGPGYQPGFSRILLTGDAAGMAEPLLGEGIYFALKTGQLAAQAIIESTYKGLPPSYLYEKHLNKVQSDLKLYALASKCLYRFQDPALFALSFSRIHKPFADAYAKGFTLHDLMTNPSCFRESFSTFQKRN